MTGQTGTQLGAYEILSPLGAGGMGEVYRARDTRLNREVAIKVLPADFANDADRLRRFEQEALATSALNHPNILTIYEFGSVATEAGATHFLASEFIDGETLRNRLQRTPLTLNEAIDIAVQTAQALAAAHEAHIIHRDIKPENVMLRKDGIVKVLDFGLAKLTEARKSERGTRNEDAETLLQGDAEIPRSSFRDHPSTLPGTVMGTVAYMSPEQARGQMVDARTDLFSLGVMLYEMLARHQPFTGETVNHVIVAILEKDPPPLAGVPAELTRILAQALAKKADERYESAQAMLADLKKLQMRLLVEAENKRNSADDAPVEAQTLIQPQATAAAPEALATAAASAQSTSPDHPKPKQWWLAAGLSLLLAVGGYFGYGYFTATRQINSIAVMPFVNDSGNADVEYLSDGMTETLISSLSQLPKLNVKARSSVFRYKGKDTKAQTIGKELNVQAILNGRVVQRGEQLTLGLELIDAQTENVIWSEQYNRKQTDLVTLQSDIARDVSSKLKTKLSGADEARVTKNYTANPEAYQLYLKGRYQWNKRAGISLKQAVEFYQQAIEKDPGYALAYSGLAESYSIFPFWGMASPQESMPQAKAAALRALALDESLAEAHAALGQYLISYAWDTAAAEKELRRAIELNPNYATAWQWLGGRVLSPMKRFDEAVAAGRRAEELDPLSLVIKADLGWTLIMARRYDEGGAQLKSTLELDPNYFYAHFRLGDGYQAKGMYAEAIAEYRKALELSPDPMAKAMLARMLAKAGQRGEAVKLLNELKAESSQRYVQSSLVAPVYATLGEKDEAFKWLEKALAERSFDLQNAVDPIFDDIRADPRFADLLHRFAQAKMD